jgi:hypothetical protein
MQLLEVSLLAVKREMQARTLCCGCESKQKPLNVLGSLFFFFFFCHGLISNFMLLKVVQTLNTSIENVIGA